METEVVDDGPSTVTREGTIGTSDRGISSVSLEFFSFGLV